MFKTLRAHLADNCGDENISKMIWVAIAFIVGAILLVMVTSAFQGPIYEWYTKVVKDWFDPSASNGAYIDSANVHPTVK